MNKEKSSLLTGQIVACSDPLLLPNFEAAMVEMSDGSGTMKSFHIPKSMLGYSLLLVQIQISLVATEMWACLQNWKTVNPQLKRVSSIVFLRESHLQ